MDGNMGLNFVLTLWTLTVELCTKNLSANMYSVLFTILSLIMAGRGGRVLRHSSMEEEGGEDPYDLWVSTPDDPVPDPGDIGAVFEYCGLRKEDYITSFYMINREMIESGMDVVPLASYEPFVYCKYTSNSWLHCRKLQNSCVQG